MKKLLFGLLFFSITISTFACTCIVGPTLRNFRVYNNVFTAKVVEVVSYYPNTKRAKQLKVKQINLYKGDSFTVIYIGESQSMCSAPNPKRNEEWVFYGTRNEAGKIVLSTCNPSKALSPVSKRMSLKKAEAIQTKLSVIKTLFSKSDKSIHWDFSISNTIKRRPYDRGINPFLKDFSVADFNTDYGLYLVKLSRLDRRVLGITIAQTQGSEIDQAITDFIKSQEFPKYNKRRINEYMPESELLIPILIWKPIN